MTNPAFHSFLQAKGLSTRSVLEAERAVDFLRSGRKIKGKSAARHDALRWASALWAEHTGQILVVPAGGQTARLKPAVSMPDDDWATLYSALERDPSAAGAVLRVMMVTGLRVGDVLRINAPAIRSALDRSDGLLEARVKGGKVIKSSVAGSRDDWGRLLVLTSTTPAWAVAPYGDGSPDAGGAAYQAVRRHLVGYTKALGLQGRVHLHRLRRSVVVQGLRAGQDVVKVAAAVGHHSIATTARYADETHPEMTKNVQDAIGKFRRKT